MLLIIILPFIGTKGTLFDHLLPEPSPGSSTPLSRLPRFRGSF